METNQLNPTQDGSKDYQKGSLNVGMDSAMESPTRCRLQAGLIAILTLVLFGCSHPSSAYYSSSSNSTPTYSGANTTSQPSTPPAASGPAVGSTSTPASGVDNGVVTPAAGNDPSANANAFIRPALLVRQGPYYAWAMPMDWQAYESGNGLDMVSPDGRMIVNSGLLTGSAGQTTPWSFVVNTLTYLGVRDIKGLYTKNLPSLPSAYPGIDWQFQEFELTCTDKGGQSVQADWICGVCNAFGGYSAIFQSFSAPVGEFSRAKTWLPMLAQSIRVINPGQIAYHDQLIPVQNRPVDDNGLMESWQQKRLSQDRIAKAQQEGMMGYERMVSPITGDHYNMPLEAYDGTVGGYRDPKYPTEILKPTQPGE